MNTIPALKSRITILLVEDNPADAEMARFALEDIGIEHNLQIAEDGEEALTYLAGQGKYKNSITPDLILLDLNLPKISGKEVLQAIKEHSDFKSIPVVILTSSEAKIDIRDAYKLEADYYITKPVTAQKLQAALGSDSNSEWFLT